MRLNGPQMSNNRVGYAVITAGRWPGGQNTHALVPTEGGSIPCSERGRGW